MINRRHFLLKSGLAVAGAALSPYSFAGNFAITGFVSNRPAPGIRKFTSKAVEDRIKEVQSAIADPELAWMFENCFPNTLDTTVTYNEINGKPDTFVITGDIHAMWLRDSSAQVWPYVSLSKNDEPLRKLIAGVINRQTRCILLDRYANAFLDGDQKSEWANDITEMKPGIHERKWEIDSLCYPVRLVYNYWKITGDTSVFDNSWRKAADLIYQTFVEQQRKSDQGTYSFKRTTAWQTDTVPGNGWGNPIKPVGLIVSIFRPSDDATIFPFLVASNYFAVVSLRQAAEIVEKVYNDTTFAEKCLALADEVEASLQKHAIVRHLSYNAILAFEVDGYGNRLMMDDTNVPSLIALPYLGCIGQDDPVYRNTRKFIFSEEHCWYYKGKALSGIGSPHTLTDMVWPMSIIMKAMTSRDAEEILECLVMIRNSHAGTGFIHESVNKDNPANYTRSWFAWANTLFGELICKIYDENPQILASRF